VTSRELVVTRPFLRFEHPMRVAGDGDAPGLVIFRCPRVQSHQPFREIHLVPWQRFGGFAPGRLVHCPRPNNTILTVFSRIAASQRKDLCLA